MRVSALPHSPRRFRGVSLVETIVAIGVLAVVVPLAIAALAAAGNTGMNAKADSRSPALVDACLSEIALARKGNSLVLDAIPDGQDFPGGDDVLCIAFDRSGSMLGKVDSEAYAKGVHQVAGKDAAYVAAIKGEMETTPDGSASSMVKLTIRIENPAIIPAAKRTRAEYITKIP